jgi:DinB family protein
MESNLKTSLWRQFGATIDTLDNALHACPDELWQDPMWPATQVPERPQVWYVVYHALFWLDLYLTGAEEGFVPPAPFTLIEQDDTGPIPERPYTKAELQGYLNDCRKRCKATIEALTDEKAQQHCRFGWGECSFLELLMYNMRHTQEHASQLNLHLGNKGVSVQDYVTQTRN